MSTDYIVSSLPTLVFGAPAPISWERFAALAGAPDPALARAWRDLETQLRNAMAEARGGERFMRHADGCSLYWKNRVLACFQERDVLKRDELPTYAIRLKIALKRETISKDGGNAAFDRLTAETRLDSASAPDADRQQAKETL